MRNEAEGDHKGSQPLIVIVGAADVRNDYSSQGETIPLEDLVLVAPCTFNTLNKISHGVADSYPLTIIASAIGKKRKVVVAPAMDKYLWNHPAVIESVKKLQSWGCHVIWPEITDSNVTMAPLGKIADTVYSTISRVRFESLQLDCNPEFYDTVEENFLEFKTAGTFMSERGLTNGSSGCVSKRLSSGILVSSSGAHIGNLHKHELSLVRDVNDGKIAWQGHQQPSSETPLLIELYNLFPKVQAIVHGHCLRITYDYKMEKYNSAEYIRYGVFGQAQRLVDILTNNDGFAILKMHGEISLGSSMEESVKKLEKRLEESHETR